MASIGSEIIVKKELRPCYVDGRKAMWHCWANSAMCVQHSPVWENPRKLKSCASFDERNTECFQTIVAIVEYSDGTVDEVMPYKVKFADHGAFREIAWEDGKAES